MEDFKLKEVSGEEVGLMVAKMAQFFSRYNLMLVRATKNYNSVAKDIYNMIEDNGKPITSSKAEIVAAATQEADEVRELKAHVGNTEQMINALKSLQKGILNEYAHV
jgi:uncharacterized protein YbcV (DUF1398 family)